MEANDELTVTYTVRDLLAEIRDDVKEVKHELSNKVDKADFVELEQRVVTLEQAWWQSKPLIGVLAASLGATGVGIGRLFL